MSIRLSVRFSRVRSETVSFATADFIVNRDYLAFPYALLLYALP